MFAKKKNLRHCNAGLEPPALELCRRLDFGGLFMRLSYGFLAFFLILPTAGAQDRSAYVRTNPDRKSWTIGNSLVERVIRFDPNMGLQTVSWRSKVTGTDFIREAGQRRSWGREFAFVAAARSTREQVAPRDLIWNRTALRKLHRPEKTSAS